jgi:hypothetical protein
VEEAPAASAQVSARHPVRLAVTDDLQRNRLTVFFRLFLAIPHIIWLSLWSVIAFLAAIVNWFATLFMARSPDGLHNFLATFLRYFTHFTAYLFLIADPYPSFTGRPGYPIDLEVDSPERQSRLMVAFRIILAIPAWIVANILGYLSRILAVFSWFIALVIGRVPQGLRNFAAFALRYEMQTYGYTLLLTQRYPSFDVKIED